MRKLLYGIIIVLAVMILADRALKVYERNAARREREKRILLTPCLTSAQLNDYASATQYRLRPYTVFGLKPGFKSDTVNINSLGLRGGEIAEKKEGSYRIVVIGGSAVFGGEVPSDNLTFCKITENILRNKYGINAEVVNAGVPAFTTMQELILLEDDIIGLRPDLVIVFDGFNDILTILRRDKRPNYPWWFSEVERVYYTSVTKLFLEKKLKKYRPTKFLLRWMDEKKGEKEIFDINTEQIKFYKRNLDLMCHLAESYRIGVVLVFQPVAMYKKPLVRIEKERIKSLDPDYVSALSRMCDLARGAMRDVARENRIPFMDGTEFFDDIDGEIFIDEVHFNERGHRIVADLLAEKINGEREKR